MPHSPPYTTTEYRRAFRDSGIWRRGVDYETAMRNDITRRGLELQIKATRRREEKNGNHPPEQIELIKAAS